MKIILDTHIFLWALAEPGKLSTKRLTELKSLSNSVFVSAVTISELMIKASIGKLTIEFDPVEMAEKSGFDLLDFKATDALLLKELPFHHKDPFDRMLVAQSVANKMLLMTDDANIKRYNCKVI